MRLLLFLALAASVHAAAILEGPREVQVAYDVDVVVTSAIQDLGTREEKRTISTRVMQLS